ncbi:MFS general substrate transporter [Mycena venus]|uniref:MFS general substrate transporter n=1 Tax=Mycena venus TaxID=2733690 RepID=A0A8H6Y2F1_9AGAR|nr:MFS general substrate transporter [Mycena venus]
MSSLEKGQNGSEIELADPTEHTPERRALERKLLRKIDLRMSILIVIYILNYIDRNNAAAARKRGLETDLHLKGQEFPTLLSILYVGYIIMQIPSNMFLNWMGRPSLYLPTAMIIWARDFSAFSSPLNIWLSGHHLLPDRYHHKVGSSPLSSRFGSANIFNSFTGALLTRFFLGFVEAAFFPGALFLISKWYKRDEIGLRTGQLCCGYFMGKKLDLLHYSHFILREHHFQCIREPYGFGNIGRYAGKARPCRMEASFQLFRRTYKAYSVQGGCFISVCTLYNAQSYSLVLIYIAEGALTVFIAVCAIFILPDFPATSKWLTPEERELALLRMTEDAGVFAFAMTAQVVALSFNAFFPTLTQTLGYSPTVTLLLCAPPFAIAALAAFFLARHSDKVGERCFHMISSYALGILGFIIAISTMNTAARYISLFLMAQSYAGFVVMYAWISNSFPRPPSKRAVALALINAFSQLGNIAGSYVWGSNWGPSYKNSYAICIACSGTTVVLALIFRQSLVHANKKLEAEEEAQGVKTPGFRYIL